MLSTVPAAGQAQTEGTFHIFPEDLENLVEDIKKLRELRDQIVSGQHAFYSASSDARLVMHPDERVEETKQSTSLLYRISRTARNDDRIARTSKSKDTADESLVGVRRMESMIGRANKRSLPDRLEGDIAASRSLQERRKSNNSFPKPHAKSSEGASANLSSPLHFSTARPGGSRERDYARSHSHIGIGKQDRHEKPRSVPSAAQPHPSQSLPEGFPERGNHPRTADRDERSSSPAVFSKNGYTPRPEERVGDGVDRFAKQRRPPSPIYGNRSTTGSLSSGVDQQRDNGDSLALSRHESTHDIRPRDMIVSTHSAHDPSSNATTSRLPASNLSIFEQYCADRTLAIQAFSKSEMSCIVSLSTPVVNINSALLAAARLEQQRQRLQLRCAR